MVKDVSIIIPSRMGSTRLPGKPLKIIAGKPMKDHFRFATAYWHTFCGTGGDPFGPGTKIFPWDYTDNPIKNAKNRLNAAFEFFTKLGTNFYCFHDRDIAPEGKNLKETIINLELMVNLAKEKQEESGVKLLWGTANLFSNPIYMNGAATNPDFKVVAHAAAQVKSAIDATIELKGDNYVFWGGREGYSSLLNTNNLCRGPKIRASAEIISVYKTAELDKSL